MRKFVWIRVLVVFVVAILVVVGLASQPASCEYIPSDLADRFASTAKEVIVEVVNFLVPIIDVICAGMVILGIILAAGLRQEFYGIRLIVSGGLGLVATRVVLLVLLSFL